MVTSTKMNETWGTHGRKNKCLEDFVGKTERNETLGWEQNIASKVVLTEIR